MVIISIQILNLRNIDLCSVLYERAVSRYVAYVGYIRVGWNLNLQINLTGLESIHQLDKQIIKE